MDFAMKRRNPSFKMMKAVISAALLSAVLVLKMIPPAKAGTTISDFDLAKYWAPVWYQDTDATEISGILTYRADYITNFAFDADWVATNNWDNLERREGEKFKDSLKAYIYYWVVETEEHWFIGYADFHPRDWEEYVPPGLDYFFYHENDMEGCLLVVKKDNSKYGSLIRMVTQAHGKFFIYDSKEVDFAAPPTSQKVLPAVYVEAKGHGVYGKKKDAYLWWLGTGIGWPESNLFPGKDEDGIIYYPYFNIVEPAHEPTEDTNTTTYYVSYALKPIDELWDLRTDYFNIFNKFGEFKSTHGYGVARAPWGWDYISSQEIPPSSAGSTPAAIINIERKAPDFFISPAFLSGELITKYLHWSYHDLLPLITGPLNFSTGPYFVGDTIKATFTIAIHSNIRDPLGNLVPLWRPLSFNTISIRGTGPNGPNDVQSFSDTVNVTLNPGDWCRYNGYFIPSKSGKYNFSCSYRTLDGWITDARLLATKEIIVEPPLPALEIIKPIQSAPSFAGPKDNPTKIELKVQITGRLVHKVKREDFEIRIGQTPANILSVTELSDCYVLEVMPSVQDENALYDLIVNIPSLSLHDTEKDAVRYSDAVNVDVVLVIDRSGSMEGEKITAAKNAAKQFVDLMNEGDQVGVVSFNDDAWVNFPLSLISPISPGAIIFSDNMESATSNWIAESPWAQITSDSHSPTTCWTDSPGRNYFDNINISLTSIAINIPADENAYLAFWHRYDLESGYDYGKVEISIDGGVTWTLLNSYTGYQSEWTQALIDLSSYAGKIIKIKFRLITDSGVTRDGWYIDDVEILKGTPPVNVKEQAKAAVNLLFADGNTSIGDGLRFGQNQLTSSGSPEHAWAVILLSDGLENEPAYVANVLPTIPDKTDVYTIALGTDADEALMQDIATETGGEYNFSWSSGLLQGLYDSIRGTVTGEETIASKLGKVIEGETEGESVQVDPTVSQATFMVSWSGSDIDLTLTDPTGVEVNPASAATDPNISFVSAITYEYYTIVSPTSGEWKLNIKGVDTPVGGEDYTARVTGRTDLTLKAYFDKDRYEAGQPVAILVSLSDALTPITGATIEVTVQAPLVGLSSWRTVNGDIVPTGPLRRSVSEVKSLHKESSDSSVFFLYDDGAHGDGRAKDGIYGNLYTNTFNSGSYIFNFNVSGTTNTGDPFTRITQRSLFVAPATNTGTISGNVSYPGWQTATIYIQTWLGDLAMYGNPDYLTSLSSAGPFVLPNLPDGTYYVLSYMDINNNGSEDTGEPFGIYGTPNPVVISGGSQAAGVDITLTLPAILVYPNPCYLNKGQDEVKIANLPSPDSKVDIYTISGELVRNLDDETEIIGSTATWDLKNDDGENVARGVYLYVVSDKSDNKKMGKIAIIK
jgi:hypothetical protein